MTASHRSRCVRRDEIVATILLTGLGMGVAPTVDSGNYLESTTRLGPGKLRLVFKEAHTALLGFSWGYSSEDYGTTSERKRASLGTIDLKASRVIDVYLEDRDHGRQVDEWTDPPAAAAAGLKAATASSVAVQTILAAALLSPGKLELSIRPRNVTFTTAGATPSDAPATATVVGTDINGDALTEVVNIAQTATIANGVKAFKTITSITYSAGDGAGATVAIGYGSVFGLSKKIRTRAGALMFGKEIANGAVVTTGTLVAPATSGPNGTYAPAAAPDGSKDYAIEYEPEGNCKDLIDGEAMTLTFRLTKAVGLL